MNELSKNIFSNQELLKIIIFSTIILISYYYIYKIFKFKKALISLLAIITIYSLIVFTNLGSIKLPKTYWQPTKDNESIILEVDNSIPYNYLYAIAGLGDTNSNKDNYQLWLYNMEVLGSNDLDSWNEIAKLGHDTNGFYKWVVLETAPLEYKYLKLVSTNSNMVLNEFGLLNTNSEFVDLKILEVSNKNNPYLATNIIDEQDQIPIEITYQNETFFDEVYHIRNGYEIANGQYMYAHVHPLLGTNLIALGSKIFGTNMFGFRFMGALASIIMLPIMYLILKELFKKEKYALIGTFLFAIEFMHLTTARIATLEPFSILSILVMYYFMIKYIKLDFYQTNIKKLLLSLFITGFCMGISWAIKWTGIYASIGLALIFFGHMINNYKINKDLFYKKYLIIIPFCLFAFILIPIIIYLLAYIPVILYREGYSSIFDYIHKIYDYTLGIYDYHSTIVATHPFESKWWEWVLNIKPIWYYVKNTDGLVNSISCFVNPTIAWGGLLAIIYLFYKGIKTKSSVIAIILLGYFSGIGPSMFVDRLLFIYHYYPSIPFLIMAIVYVIYDIYEYHPKYIKFVKGFLVLSLLLFILFLPVITGFTTNQTYIDTVLTWFPTWYF